MKRALVFGAGGFIGSHMVRRLKHEGYYVSGVDLKLPEYWETKADEFHILDLRDYDNVASLLEIDNNAFDEIYQFAADMGGAGFVFTGENDADILHNSASINLNLLDAQRKLNSKLSLNKTKIFYSSSACIYPAFNQMDPENPICIEDSAYPAEPDSEYGWEKLFSERLYLAFKRNYGIPISIARYHNIFGPYGTWDGGREKAPAAICRKIALSKPKDTIEIWGDGLQTRSFLYIDECIEATFRLMKNDKFFGPVNIGSEEMISINNLVALVSTIANKEIGIEHIEGPVGVRGRNSSNNLIESQLGWNYKMSLKDGLKKTYEWISTQIHSNVQMN